MKIGTQVSFDKTYAQVLKSDISNWEAACKKAGGNRVAATDKEETTNANNLTLKCIVTDCEGSYVVNKNKTGCEPAKGR